MHVYELIRWLIAVVVGLFGWWIILLNFSTVYQWYVHRKHHSTVPLFGGFLGFLGMGACPLHQVQRFAWVPLAIDIAFFLTTLALGLAGMMWRRAFRETKNEVKESTDN